MLLFVYKSNRIVFCRAFDGIHHILFENAFYFINRGNILFQIGNPNDMKTETENTFF